jgi:RecA-family ATPase
VLYDADDEAALLGAALITHQAAVLVATNTTAADFHVPFHGRVREAIAALITAGQPVDVATVASDISRRNGVTSIEEAKRSVRRLLQACPASANAPAYLQSVRDWTYRRQLTTASKELLDAAHDGDPDIIRLARQTLTDLRDDTTRRFRRWAAHELLEQDRTFRWLARGLLCQPTYGMLGGPRKTLKTYLLLFIGLGVAAGEAVLGQFDVDEPGTVVYYVGEGGRIPMTRRLERVAEAIGYNLKDLPLFLHFETEPMNSPVFQETLRRDLDELRPAAVIIDPFYAFHGTEVKAADLHQEGALLSSVSTPCAEAGASLLLGNHFNKTGTGRGLDRITQAGGQEWSDTWMLVSHRSEPDVDLGEFQLLLDIGSRQWGGATWDLDLRIGRFDPDTGEFDGPITWQVDRHTMVPAEALADTILDILADMPWAYTKTQVRERAGAKITRFNEIWGELRAGGHIVAERLRRLEEGRSATRDLWAPAGTPRPAEPTPDPSSGTDGTECQLDLTDSAGQEAL